MAIDVAQYYLDCTPFGRAGKPPDVLTAPYVEQVLLGYSIGILSWAQLALIYHLLALVLVGLGISSHFYWPPAFGSPLKAFTVRNAWGSSWHQYLRRIFETAGSKTSSFLRLRKGSFASKYVKLYVAFLVSGLIHYAGALNVPYNDSAYAQPLFFLVQAVGISIEDFVIFSSKKMGIIANRKYFFRAEGVR